MSRLLEILGKAITVDTADLIWHWLSAVELGEYKGESSHSDAIRKISELVSSRKLDAAAEQLKLYLFENPSCIRGRMAAAAICLHNGQLQNAIEELNSVYLRRPSNTMALYALGHCCERLGREAQAVEFYQDCLKFKNYLQLPRQRLAAIYFKNGQLEKTIQEYELLKNEYPDDISTLVTLGYLCIADAKYRNAIEILNSAILMHPDNFHAEDEDVNQLIIDGQLDQALEQLGDLLEMQPERADLMMKRADVLGMLGTADEAVSQYEEVLRICPDFLEATIKLGTQYLQLNHEQPAAQQFNKAVEINDQIVDAYIGLAISQKLAGDIQDALSTLSLAAAIQPNSSLLFAQTASLQFKIGFDVSSLSGENDAGNLLELVIGAHRKQIDRQPQNPDLHYRLGVLMMSVERINDAIKSFQTVLNINPTYTRARNKLAVCLFLNDQQQAAMEQLTAPECLDKDTLELHYKTALLYCDKVRFASSLMNLEHYMEDNFASEDATVNISIVLQNLGLLDRAAAMWDNLVTTTSRAIDAHQSFSSGN